MTSLAPEDVKACCAAAYASPAARWLLGDSYHPGGAALTLRLVGTLRLGPGQLLADVASGPGTSAILAARETGCDVVGIDLSPESVEAAGRAADDAGVAGRVRFLAGDAEALPLDDGSVDAALCECALCTFPDKQAAAVDLARILRPGGRLALSDMTAEPERLPPELTGVAAWVACLGGAEPLGAIADRIRAAGLEVETTERHDAALTALLDRVEARLKVARMMGEGIPAVLRSGVDRGLELVGAARAAVADGALGYGAVIARKP